jgi:hypothetical protein
VGSRTWHTLLTSGDRQSQASGVIASVNLAHGDAFFGAPLGPSP